MTLGDKIAKGKQIVEVAGNSSKETNARARSAKAKSFAEGGGGKEAGVVECGMIKLIQTGVGRWPRVHSLSNSVLWWQLLHCHPQPVQNTGLFYLLITRVTNVSG